MPRMMRMTFAVMFVCALAACGSGGSTGDDDPAPDASSTIPKCGDSVCLPSEVSSCPQDCGSAGPTCGNNTCEAGETTTSCPSDCQQTGPVCGDQVCDAAGGENNGNCPGDCPIQGGQCPTDVTECAECAILGTSCPAGLDMTSCLNCILMMP